MKYIKTKANVIALITLFLISVLAIVNINSINKKLELSELNNNKNKIKINYLENKINSELNTYLVLDKNNVGLWINAFDIKYPEIVLNQSILESGNNYFSNNARLNNNIFGFQKSEDSKLLFNHWIESIIYYKKWQDKYYENGDYYLFLKKYGYASDTMYINKLKQFKNE